MYEQMFGYIFGKINEILDVKNTIKSNDTKNTVIGVLDIYGFEIFDNNGLEIKHFFLHALLFQLFSSLASKRAVTFFDPKCQY